MPEQGHSRAARLSERQSSSKQDTARREAPAPQANTPALMQGELDGSGMPTASEVLRLQRTFGNRAVGQFLSTKHPAIQRHLQPVQPVTVEQKAGQGTMIQRAFATGRVVTLKSMVVLPGNVWVEPGTKALVTQGPAGESDVKIQLTTGESAGMTASVPQKELVELPDNPLTQLIKVIDEAHISRWSDDYLLEILRGSFASNWFNLRNSLTLDMWPEGIPKDAYPKRSASLLLMDKMVGMRDRKWKAFKDGVLPRVKGEVQRVAEQHRFKSVGKRLGHHRDVENQAKTFDPQGSQAVTSDIDLSTGGKNTEIFVGFINREFRAAFGVPYDPGTMFDINVYAADWIHGDTMDTRREEAHRVLTPKPESAVTGKGMLAAERRNDQLEIWSLVKIRRNMEAHEWEAYKEEILHDLEGDDYERRLGKFARAESEYRIFMGQVKLKMKQLEATDQLLQSTGASSMFDKHRAKEGLETRASNDLYAEILLRVKDLRVQIELKNKELETRPADETLKNEINRLGIALGYAIAESLTYANEVYASEGAVQHTVLAQGAKGKLEKLKAEEGHLKSLSYNLTKEAYIQAVNENVGDSLHSLHAYEEVPSYAVYRAGKYLARLMDATDKLLGKVSSTTGAKITAESVKYYAELKQVGDESVKAKAIKTPIGKSGKELEGVPDTVKKNTFFSQQTHASIDTLRKHIGIFAAAVSKLGQRTDLAGPAAGGETAGEHYEASIKEWHAKREQPIGTHETAGTEGGIRRMPPELLARIREFNGVFAKQKDKESASQAQAHTETRK